MGHLATAAQARWLEIQTQTWYEWIDSDSNPSDGLSRAGLQDAWTLAQGWHLEEHGESLMRQVTQYLQECEFVR